MQTRAATPPAPTHPAATTATHDLVALARRVVEGHRTTREEALAIVRAPEADLLSIVHAASIVRRAVHGDLVRVHVLQNAKSGVCTEDCAFCSQSLRYNTADQVAKYPMQQVDELVAGAERAVAAGAVTYCMVTATRGPQTNEIDRVSAAAQQIKAAHPGLRLCASLGLLQDGQAEALKAAGIDRYNHNLETSPRHFPNVVTTHGIEQRMDTVRRAKAAGLEACCGGIVGMGEDEEDRVDLALELRELEVESVPLNFLDPRPGTPMGEATRLSPVQCVQTLAMFRLVHPRADLRIAGGREVTLRSLQPLALHAANSMFTDGYLTTPGATPSADLQMIRDAGFEPEVIVEGPDAG